MCDVDINHSHAVFKTFCVHSDTEDRGNIKEPYIPSSFLLVAMREMGYYPIRSEIESFLARIPSTANSEIHFSEFVQLCEELVDSRALCMAAVHQFVYQLECKNSSGIFTTKELLSLLNPSACLMTQGEVEAVISMLDPKQTDRVSLETLVTVLLRRQRPLGEMPCQYIVTGDVFTPLPKDDHSATLSSRLPRNLIDCSQRNASQQSPPCKRGVSHLSTTPSRHKREIHYKDEPESVGSHNLQNSDFNPRIVSHIDVKASTTPIHPFTRSPTDMSVIVDPLTESERLRKRAAILSVEKNNDIPKFHTLGESTRNTINSMVNSRKWDSSSMQRVCDLSGVSLGLETHSTSKEKVYGPLLGKEKGNRTNCCVIC